MLRLDWEALSQLDFMTLTNAILNITLNIFSTLNPLIGIKANVWAAKYHEAEEGKKLWKVIVPKEMQKVKCYQQFYITNFIIFFLTELAKV